MSISDWKLCIICQTNTKESLQCPADSKRKDLGAGYRSFLNNLQEFHRLGCLPEKFTLSFPVEVTSENGNLEEILFKNKAAWHKSCKEIFSNAKLERARKRKLTQVTKEEEEEDREDENDNDEPSTSPIKARRSMSKNICYEKNFCFFCDVEDNLSNLHSVCTFEVDSRVRQCAELLQDHILLSKLASCGDMIAKEAKYHAKCLVSLYNKARQIKKSTYNDATSQENTVDDDELAFTETVAYIDDQLETQSQAILKLSDIVNLFSSKLSELTGQNTNVNSTRLKERVMVAFPNLEAFPQGRDVLLVPQHEVGGVLKEHKENKDSKACCLAKAAKILRKEILKVKNTFNGTFSQGCQQNAIPACLKTFISLLLKGSNSKASPDDNQACLTIGQLTVFNSVSKSRDNSESCGTSHHVRTKECPLPLYTAIKIHGVARNRNLIDTFYHLGMSVSYDRLLSLSTEVANSVVETYENDGVVCPFKLRRDVFTTAAVDNIDHNPSATTSKDSFHGTAISLAQHLTTENPGIIRENSLNLDKRLSTKKVSQLPSYYCEVRPMVVNSSTFDAPKGMAQSALTVTPIDYLLQEEDWLEACSEGLSKDVLADTDIVSWAAYRASQSSLMSHQPALISLLPMFTENAHSAAMIAHAIKVVREATHHLNPSQTPVLAVDQPLYAIAKQIQWSLGGIYSEENLIVMCGGLHIEMAAFKALGKWVEGSGWKESLVDAGVATDGVAESFVSAKHLTRTRRAHQVTAASLYVLMRKAYDSYVEQHAVAKSFEEWKMMKSKQPQFQYWNTVLELEILCLQFVRAVREGNFAMYVRVLRLLLPWFFALDSHNYARWLSVHYRDMSKLRETHPSVFTAFTQGSFVVHKSRKPFSAIALDHAHEQVNAVVKGEGGAVGLTESAAALRRWMIAGPELSRMIEEFEDVESNDHITKHHESMPSFQRNFIEDVRNLITSLENSGNPFLEESNDLIALHSKDIMDEDVVKTVMSIEKIGEDQCKQFLEERLQDKAKTLSDTLKKNSFSTFVKKSTKKGSDKAKLKMLKEDCALFGRLYIACQNRDGDIEEFFQFENQPWPPSLSQLGKLRSGTKSDLVKCLPTPSNSKIENATAVILDGAVVVQMLLPSTASTFHDYFDEIFGPYVLRHLETASRVDIVFDVYINGSLKQSTREKRGSGQRRKVTSSTRIPTDWKGFLRVDDNKSELFNFLSEKMTSISVPFGKEINSTHGNNVLTTTPNKEMNILKPCSHEEADTRMMLHVLDASVSGHQKIKVRSNDTDVVVLCISIAPLLSLEELWVSHGSAKQITYIPAHEIAEVLGREKASVLPLFHALTGCDTVSFFAGRGKKTAWDVWNVFPDLTSSLKSLMANPESMSADIMTVIERYTVLLYDRTSNHKETNRARLELFSKKSRSLENIPPTQACLIQHVKRAVYQGALIWGKTLLKEPMLPSPEHWGWKYDESNWVPHWTDLPQVKDACYELIKCGCKTTCKGRCKCVKANLACTQLCNCGGCDGS